jgi:chemotaxis protein MotB
MAESTSVPIIIKKKVSGHGGHHGGAWKVAYADFVTAMMALFIVLWLMNSSKKVQEAVGGYFRDPSGIGKISGNGVAGNGEGVSVGLDDMEKLKEKLDQAMRKMPEFKNIKEQVLLTVTGEGLRIEMLETDKGMFFEVGSPKPSASGQNLLLLLAAELGKMPNMLLIEGHTDSKPFASDGPYSNWELSADRANAARRLMQASGLRAAQVVQVRGYADQKLRKPNDPLHASNRRISVLVEYQEPAAKADQKSPPAAAHTAPPKH